MRNVWVHHNVVRMSAGQSSGAVTDTADPGIFTNNNRFDANSYFLHSLTQPHFTWAGTDLPWTEWRTLGNGQDLNGRAELW